MRNLLSVPGVRKTLFGLSLFFATLSGHANSSLQSLQTLTLTSQGLTTILDPAQWKISVTRPVETVTIFETPNQSVVYGESIRFDVEITAGSEVVRWGTDPGRYLPLGLKFTALGNSRGRIEGTVGFIGRATLFLNAELADGRFILNRINFATTVLPIDRAAMGELNVGTDEKQFRFNVWRNDPVDMPLPLSGVKAITRRGSFPPGLEFNMTPAPNGGYSELRITGQATELAEIGDYLGSLVFTLKDGRTIEKFLMLGVAHRPLIVVPLPEPPERPWHDPREESHDRDRDGRGERRGDGRNDGRRDDRRGDERGRGRDEPRGRGGDGDRRDDRREERREDRRDHERDAERGGRRA